MPQRPVTKQVYPHLCNGSSKRVREKERGRNKNIHRINSRAKNIQWRKESLTNGAEKSGKPRAKNETSLSPDNTQKLTQKWITDVNIRSETIKYIEENTVTIPTDVGLRVRFFVCVCEPDLKGIESKRKK